MYLGGEEIVLTVAPPREHGSTRKDIPPYGGESLKRLCSYVGKRGAVFRERLMDDLAGYAVPRDPKATKRLLADLASLDRRFLLRYEFHTQYAPHIVYALGLRGARLTKLGFIYPEPQKALQWAVGCEVAAMASGEFQPLVSASVLAGLVDIGGATAAVWCPREEDFAARTIAQEIPAAASCLVVCAGTSELLEWCRVMAAPVRVPVLHTADDLLPSGIVVSSWKGRTPEFVSWSAAREEVVFCGR